MSKILSVYKIFYPEFNVSQVKNLISHNDYINDIKPKMAEIARLEAIAPKSKTNERKIAEFKKYIKDMFGSEYFTDNSPIWNSQFNNGKMILTPQQGGEIMVELIKLDN